MAESFYEDSDPAYVTKGEHKKGSGPSIFMRGTHWSRNNWADYVAKSAARTVLDRLIYRAVAQATRDRVRVDAATITSQLQDEAKAVPVMLILAPRGGRHEMVARRIRYMVWLGVLINSTKFGVLAIEHVSLAVMMEIKKNRTDHRTRDPNSARSKRRYQARKLAKQQETELRLKHAATPSPIYHYPSPGPASLVPNPSGPMRTVGDGPGDV